MKRICSEAFTVSYIAEIRVPDSVEELCDHCFCDALDLSRVHFGKKSSLKRIGVGAFRSCYLQEICIPDSVTELGDLCFYESKLLERVKCRDSSSLKRIGEGCFSCSGLGCFSLPVSVTSIGGSAFSECPMSYFQIRNKNSPFASADSLLLSKDRRLCYSSLGIARHGVIIPGSVEEICDRCFYGCASVTYAMMRRESLRRIGTEAFFCSSLETVRIPEKVEEIGDRCFFGCAKLTLVMFWGPPSLKRIGTDAFGQCPLLEEIRIPMCIVDLLKNDIPLGVRVVKT